MFILSGDKCEFRLKVTALRLALLFAVLMVSFTARECGSEDYSLASYYPVPYGSFQRLSVYKRLYITTDSTPTMTVSWPVNTRIRYDTTGTFTDDYFDDGYSFLVENAPMRIAAGKGDINLIVNNASNYDNQILIKGSAGQPVYLKNFCYWHSTSAQTCLGTSPAWRPLAVTMPSGGVCNGSALVSDKSAALAAPYCVLCCKFGP